MSVYSKKKLDRKLSHLASSLARQGSKTDCPAPLYSDPPYPRCYLHYLSLPGQQRGPQRGTMIYLSNFTAPGSRKQSLLISAIN